jgi:hypothetical protein
MDAKRLGTPFFGEKTKFLNEPAGILSLRTSVSGAPGLPFVFQ